MTKSHLPRQRLLAAAMLVLIGCCSAAPALAQRSLMSDDDSPDSKSCMTDRMMRNFLTDQGYTNVKLNVSQGRNWPAQGIKGGQRQLLTVDTCSRQIYHRGGR